MHEHSNEILAYARIHYYLIHCAVTYFADVALNAQIYLDSMLAIVLAALGALTASCNMFGMIYLMKWVTKKLKSRKTSASPEGRHSNNKSSDAQCEATCASESDENNRQLCIPKKGSYSSAGAKGTNSYIPRVNIQKLRNISYRRTSRRNRRRGKRSNDRTRYHIDLMDENVGNRYRMKRNINCISDRYKSDWKSQQKRSMRDQARAGNVDRVVGSCEIKQNGGPDTNETGDSDTTEIHHC